MVIYMKYGRKRLPKIVRKKLQIPLTTHFSVCCNRRRQRNRDASRDTWKHSSAGRAPALQAGGHRFEPYSAHHFYFFGPIAQLVRALACHARGHGFEPRLGRSKRLTAWRHASVAQLVEQGIENSRVVGSIPTGGINKRI